MHLKILDGNIGVHLIVLAKRLVLLIERPVEEGFEIILPMLAKFARVDFEFANLGIGKEGK